LGLGLKLGLGLRLAEVYVFSQTCFRASVVDPCVTMYSLSCGFFCQRETVI